MNTTEFWKDVPGYGGKYQISNFGRIKSLCWGKEKILTGNKGASHGYLSVSLSRGRNNVIVRTVHSLVAELFIPNTFKLPQVCHINGDKLNNRVDNLRWDTPTGNAADQLIHGTRYAGEAHHNCKLSTKEVEEIRVLWDTNTVSQRELGRRYGVSGSTVCTLVNYKHRKLG